MVATGFCFKTLTMEFLFKLVDGEYLATCGATVGFAGKGINMSLKGDYDVAFGEYSEVAFDMEECMAKNLAEG